MENYWVDAAKTMELFNHFVLRMHVTLDSL